MTTIQSLALATAKKLFKAAGLEKGFQIPKDRSPICTWTYHAIQGDLETLITSWQSEGKPAPVDLSPPKAAMDRYENPRTREDRLGAMAFGIGLQSWKLRRDGASDDAIDDAMVELIERAVDVALEGA